MKAKESPVRIRFALGLMFSFSMATMMSRPALAELPARDVSARARAIGTDKPYDDPARLIVTNPDRARLRFPAFVLGIEKARRAIVGCPPDRGLDTSRAPKVVRDQIRRTFHETPLALDCLFVSHIAEFVKTSDPAVFAPILRYDAYREADPPAPRKVFASGRQATLALGARLREIAAERTSAGRPVSHLVVFATGWHTPQAKTLAQMDELFGSITAAAAEDDTFSPLIIGVSWPSFSDEIADNIEKGALVFAAMARFHASRCDPGDRIRRELALADRVGRLSRFLNDPEIADNLGYLGYLAVSKDADEVGMVPASTLVNQVLIPVRETLPGKPPVVVIGHSFGARIASWTPFTAPLLPAVDGAVDVEGPDLIFGLQAAFPAARFDATVKHHRPYVEGPSFADRAAFRTVFAYTCAQDEFLRRARIFDIMIGDAKAFERARDIEVPAFRTYKVIDGEVAGLELDRATQKVILIDAREIIAGHNDVRNREVGWLVWTLMKKRARR